MRKDPNYYHCDLPPDMSMYDHLPYKVNPSLGDGSNIGFYSGNVLRGCPVNYLEEKIIVPNGEEDSQ